MWVTIRRGLSRTGGGLVSGGSPETAVYSSPSVQRRRHVSRTSRMRPESSSLMAEVDPVVAKHLAKYSKYQPSPVSMQHFLDFGHSGSPQSSFMFLRRELPVRLANIMREIQYLPAELKETEGCRLINRNYLQSFREIMEFEDCAVSDPKVMDDFTNQLMTIRERHSDLVTVMAKAVLQVKNQYTTGPEERRITKLPKFERNIQYFLDRLYTSRISTRMLINQHTLLFGERMSDDRVQQSRQRDASGVSHVGAIDPRCHLIPLVERAFENARFLAEQYYMTSPELIVRSYDLTTDPTSSIMHDNETTASARIECVQVPSHVYHVLFELFKNALRATVEHHGEDAITLPPVVATVVKSREDVTIKITDRGGGIPKRLITQVFQYLYTTAPDPALALSASDPSDLASQLGQQSVPLAGHGYGLPLSRLYARYLSGDLELYSMHGFGTDALLHLQAIPEEAKERLPVWHETGTKRIYEAQLVPDDWTTGGAGHDMTSGRFRKKKKASSPEPGT